MHWQTECWICGSENHVQSACPENHKNKKLCVPMAAWKASPQLHLNLSQRTLTGKNGIGATS